MLSPQRHLFKEDSDINKCTKSVVFNGMLCRISRFTENIFLERFYLFLEGNDLFSMAADTFKCHGGAHRLYIADTHHSTPHWYKLSCRKKKYIYNWKKRTTQFQNKIKYFLVTHDILRDNKAGGNMQKCILYFLHFWNKILNYRSSKNVTQKNLLTVTVSLEAFKRQDSTKVQNSCPNKRGNITLFFWITSTFP